ncbi:MAG TPA: GcrA family cell cycle regulator [Sphingomonas sp.]|nr:GcrA family cell cycle regulator [Sphingomonas sp.]
MPAIAPTWTTERVERLKNCFEAGFSCREIAADIGVSRNAVIGKLSRLNLTRDAGGEPPVRKTAGAAPAARAAPRRHYAMFAAYAEPERPPEPIDDARRCSLFELNEARCRWPISTPGAADFCFCGNTPLDGLPYCSGHCRLAYRPGSRQRVARG